MVPIMTTKKAQQSAETRRNAAAAKLTDDEQSYRQKSIEYPGWVRLCVKTVG